MISRWVLVVSQKRGPQLLPGITIITTTGNRPGAGGFMDAPDIPPCAVRAGDRVASNSKCYGSLVCRKYQVLILLHCLHHSNGNNDSVASDPATRTYITINQRITFPPLPPSPQFSQAFTQAGMFLPISLCNAGIL